jgi:hypothetical protein
VSHAAPLVAVQLQPLAAVTVNVPDAPLALTLTDAGESDGAHSEPACATVKVPPPIVIDPVRDALDVFAAIEYDTEPSLVPVAPCVTLIHASLLTAVQLQPLAAVTATTPVDAPASTLTDVGKIDELHGALAWVTVKGLPPIVSVPVRDVVAVFAATSNVTEPLPLPLAPAVTVIHAALLVAVQAHPVAAVTVTAAAVTPAAATLDDADESVGAHGAPACVTSNVLPPIVSVAVRGVVAGFAVTV